MKKWIMLLIGMLCTVPAFAGDAENISACVKKAKDFSSMTLDPFLVNYEGNIVSMSIARWENVHCEVKFGDVYNLKINNEYLIYKGYAGKESYELKQSMEGKTDEAISRMDTHIVLLKQRLDQVEASLKKPNPDHAWLNRYIEEGIDKSFGSAQSTCDAVKTKKP